MKLVENPKSYQPISLLCVPYKILERLIYAGVEPIIDPLLPKEQGGFRHGKSTVDQVVFADPEHRLLLPLLHRLKRYYPLQVRHKQDCGRGFILLLPQTAVLPESDAGSDVIKPASSFVIQNRQTSCSIWCSMYCMGHAVRTWSAVCSEAPHSQFGEGARPHSCTDEWNRPTPVRRRLSLTQTDRGKPIPTGLGSGHKSTEPGSIFAVLRFPFVVCPFKSADAKFGKVLQKISRNWHKRTEPGSIFAVLRFPFVVCLFRSADAEFGKVLQKIPRNWYKRASGS